MSETSETMESSDCSVASAASPSAIHESGSDNTPFSSPSMESTSTDAQPVCLVSHGSSKKIVALKGSRKLADLQESLRTSGFAHLMASNPLIQVSVNSAPTPLSALVFKRLFFFRALKIWPVRVVMLFSVRVVTCFYVAARFTDTNCYLRC